MQAAIAVIDPIDQDFSGCRFIKSAQQADECGFTAPGRSDNGERFTLEDIQVYMPEYRVTNAVGE